MSDLISRRAAYEALTAYYHHTTDMQHAALYDALNRVPSAQPEKRTEKRTETHACDLISRQAAIDGMFSEMPGLTFAGVLRVLQDLPSAQPEKRTENTRKTHGVFLDVIDRQAAIDALSDGALVNYQAAGHNNGLVKAIDIIKGLPSAQPEQHYDEWCTDCKEYDKERHCCPRFNRVIRETIKEMRENERDRFNQ